MACAHLFMRFLISTSTTSPSIISKRSIFPRRKNFRSSRVSKSCVYVFVSVTNTVPCSTSTLRAVPASARDPWVVYTRDLSNSMTAALSASGMVGLARISCSVRCDCAMASYAHMCEDWVS